MKTRSYEIVWPISWRAVVNSRITKTSHSFNFPAERTGNQYRTNEKVQVIAGKGDRVSRRFIYFDEKGPYIMNPCENNKNVRMPSYIPVPSKWEKLVNDKTREVAALINEAWNIAPWGEKIWTLR